jgi:hypothetical protein
MEQVVICQQQTAASSSFALQLDASTPDLILYMNLYLQSINTLFRSELDMQAEA